MGEKVKQTKRFWRVWWVTIVALGLASCTVPRHMRVRTSDDPENVDRFCHLWLVT